MAKVLDVACGAGGASMGYAIAGHEVEGVDLCRQPRYPFRFHHADGIEFILRHGKKYDFIHASWPCQRFTVTQRIQLNEHPDLVAPGREALNATGRPWVMENVMGAPLRDPKTLCGCMFPGLNVYRPRLFEVGGGFDFPEPGHREHAQPQTKMGRPPVPGERMHVVGNFSGVKEARLAMGISWMTRDELREAIPPAYTEYIGRHVAVMLGLSDPAATVIT